MEDSKIIGHIVYSQDIHKKHGGVVPELASRSHLDKLQQITPKLIEKIDSDLNKVDIFAATCGPGLIGSLLVGSTFTKSLSLSFNKPFVPINHLEGHIMSTSFNNNITYPHLVLLLTGGHTQIYLMHSQYKIQLLGESVDDAIGEAFDKTAKILGLNYPGGVEIEKEAKTGDENAFKLPKPLLDKKSFNFSFSGIKTFVNVLVKNNSLNKKFISDMSASFQKTMSEIINSKLEISIEMLKKEGVNIKSISIVGGVANNKYIKGKLKNMFFDKEISILYPIKEMMGDNAAMIAWACINNYNKEKNNIHFKPQARMKIV